MPSPCWCYNNRSAQPWEIASGSLAESLLSERLNPHKFSAPDAIFGLLSVALDWGSLYLIETPHSWGEEVLHPPISQPTHIVWGPALSPSPPFLSVSMWLLL